MATMTERLQVRIPTALQAVFLASNRGEDVKKAPPQNVGSKVFFRNWFFQRRAGSNSSNNESSSKKFSLWGSGSVAAENIGAGTKETAIKETTSSTPTLSPQAFLDTKIRMRGYSTRRYMALQSGYYNKPTPLQQASYSKEMIEVVRSGYVETFDAMLSAGLSPNPCNSYGESILHMVCRRGDVGLLQVMLKNGCTVQVADDYGRTPLHDACWSANPALDVFHLLVERDPRLLHMQDKRGCLPLNYVRQEHWAEWNAYIVKMMDVYWPILSEPEGPPPLTKEAPNSRPIFDPPGALPLDMAEMVASGRMKPHEARCLVVADAKRSSFSEETSATEEDYDDEDEDDDSEWDSDEDDDVDEDELAELLAMQSSLKNAKATAQA